MREKARRGERSSERDSKHDDRSEGSEEGSGCVGTQRAIRGLMAAGVGPSSTVARQTPVRKHVNGGSTRALAPTSSHRRPTGRIFFQPSRQRVREFGPLIRHPRSRALSRTPTGMDVVLPVTIVGAGFCPGERRDVEVFFFPEKKIRGSDEPRRGTTERTWTGKQRSIIKRYTVGKQRCQFRDIDLERMGSARDTSSSAVHKCLFDCQLSDTSACNFRIKAA